MDGKKKEEENPLRASLSTSAMKILLRGGGDLASGVAWRLYQCGFRISIAEIAQPMAVRRTVSFCEAVYEDEVVVEGVKARRAAGAQEVDPLWGQGLIAVLVDPTGACRHVIRPDVIVDAILAKKNLGTGIDDAPLVIALGPGFEAGKDAHFVVETNRGHNLGRLLTRGSAEPDTGSPGPVMGITTERVLRAPASGRWVSGANIGDTVKREDLIGSVGARSVTAGIGGVLRGLIRPGIEVAEGLKIGDIDPRGKHDFCFTISEKALAIAGGVLEGILRFYGA